MCDLFHLLGLMCGFTSHQQWEQFTKKKKKVLCPLSGLKYN